MTTGIYALYWEEQDLIYIGQSKNIERRFGQHLYKLANNIHSNYKVQIAYNTYRSPVLVVLERCSIDKLNTLEVYWTKEYDSLNSVHGLNIVEAGDVLNGTDCPASVFSRRDILKAFSLLYRTNYTQAHIEDKTGVTKSVIGNIFTGRCHLWLEEEYPEEYNIMVQKSKLKQNSAARKGIEYPKVVSPEGVVYKVDNLQEFARDHDINKGSLCMLLNGKRKSANKWRLA